MQTNIKQINEQINKMIALSLSHSDYEVQTTVHRTITECQQIIVH